MWDTVGGSYFILVSHTMQKTPIIKKHKDRQRHNNALTKIMMVTKY